VDDSTVPRPRSVRLDALGLSSTDAFVLARIDGACTLEEVADSTGLSVEVVIAIARRLEQLGAIERPGARSRPATSGRYSDAFAPATDESHVSEVPPRPPPPPPHYARKRWQNEAPREPSPAAKPASSTPSPRSMRPSRVPGEKRAAGGRLTLRPASSAGSSRPPRSAQPPLARQSERALRPAAHDSTPRRPVVASAKEATSPPPPTPPPPTPPEETACDLDAETIAKIEAASTGAAGRTHYALLGVSRRADAKEIRRAYFAIAAALHPDRFFGKRLGPHKKKLEHAFRLASDAYEVLRIAAKRAEYDQYLRLTRQSVQMEAALDAPLVEAPPDVAPQPTVRPTPPPAPTSAPAAARIAPTTPTAATAPVAHRFEPVAFAAPTPPIASIEPPPAPSVAARPPASEGRVAVAAPVLEPAPTSPRAPASAPTNDPPRAADGRRFLAASKSASLLEGAQKALAQGDAAAAANLYRLALHYAEDASTRGYAQSGLQEARSTLADTLLMKARYEEKESRWSDAVASYAKALEGRPDDPSICERLANALRQEGLDLPRATRLAELAVSRAPRRAAYRKTLGLVYADAGMREKALEELEKACELDPSDEQASHALAALRKRRR
jgi:curved DNA-binding protein CbpA